MAMQLAGTPVSARNEAPTWTALVLEMVALRHRIAVLKRSGTRRPCFRFQDPLFWLLLARWWPSWRDSLVIRMVGFERRFGRIGDVTSAGSVVSRCGVAKRGAQSDDHAPLGFAPYFEPLTSIQLPVTGSRYVRRSPLLWSKLNMLPSVPAIAS
jgi:hypothetical protein